jgi:methionyl-tRNA synthetase
MSWGIELPFDKNFVAYVWFDALVNYISGAGYPADMARFKKLWPCDVHMIGKDILRHHAVYWPIMLHAAGIAPPRSIFAHGWWVIKGEKMSKSKGNVVDPMEMITRYGVDPYRYFLLREVQFGQDGAFSEEAFVARYNSDLANDLGNLLNRTLTMVGKYFGGKVPSYSVQRTAYSVQEKNLKAKTMNLASELEKAMPEFAFSDALAKVWEVINMANKLIEESKPWALAKEKRVDELASVIRALLETLRTVAIAIYPVMPAAAAAIYAQLGLAEDVGSSTIAEMRKYPAFKDSAPVSTPKPIFPRIESKTIQLG